MVTNLLQKYTGVEREVGASLGLRNEMLSRTQTVVGQECKYYKRYGI